MQELFEVQGPYVSLDDFLCHFFLKNRVPSFKINFRKGVFLMNHMEYTKMIVHLQCHLLLKL